MGDRFLFRQEAILTPDHPAVRAWSTLVSDAPLPGRVEVLQTRKGKMPSRKSIVYRLSWSDGTAAPVIAKRTRRSSAQKEVQIYQTILCDVPVPSVRCYGGIDDEDEAFGWIFLEEVPGRPYDEERLADRTLAAHWLGTVHAATGKLEQVRNLPALEADRYLTYLRLARAKIEANLGNTALQNGDLQVLRAIIQQCNALEARWSEIEHFYAAMPQCLVHGDFIAKNLRVHAEGEKTALYAIDWESAGWGVPAEDLGGLDCTIADFEGVDLDAYWRKVQPAWSRLDRNEVAQLIHTGIVFRYLAWIHATSVGLAYEWLAGTVEALTVYADRLDHARRLAGLD